MIYIYIKYILSCFDNIFFLFWKIQMKKKDDKFGYIAQT